MDGNYLNYDFLYTLLIKIRPLMDGNISFVSLVIKKSNIKIRPLGDGNFNALSKSIIS
jgi:hypothetical protein